MSGRTKMLLLMSAVLLAVLLCYRFAISNTLEQRNAYKKLEAERALLKNAPQQLALLMKKQVYYDSVLGKMNLGNTSIENNLLRVINIEAEKNALKLIDFNDPHRVLVNANRLNTFDFTLDGEFTSLLKTIYTLEQKNNFGEVVHLHFLKNKNFRTNKEYLTARVFIQNIE
ncbi:hypothetical protein [Maribacter sp. 2-571]|uniref:hypothetical protein n=1 Tax=Maribacter sp. 2-571 TaxID=3417569 RepID=UPI003D34D0E1